MKKLATIVAVALLAIFVLGASYQDGVLIFDADAIFGGGSRVDPPAWEDVRVPVNSVKAGGSAPGFESFLGAGGLKTYLFDDSSDEEVHFVLQLSHNYKFGTDLHCHVHWTPTTGAAGNVTWCLEYSFQEINGTFPAVTTDCGTDATSGTAWDHQITEIETVDGSAVDSVSSMLVGRLYRDVDNGDDYGADAALLEFDCHYQIDSFGSDTEYSKN